MLYVLKFAIAYMLRFPEHQCSHYGEKEINLTTLPLRNYRKLTLSAHSTPLVWTLFVISFVLDT